jgi:hypothetical protein
VALSIASGDSTLQVAGMESTTASGGSFTEVDDNAIPVTTSPSNIGDNAYSFQAIQFGTGI